jgi:hypothetical protein
MKVGRHFRCRLIDLIVKALMPDEIRVEPDVRQAGVMKFLQLFEKIELIEITTGHLGITGPVAGARWTPARGDNAFTIYARCDESGRISVRRVEGDVELAQLVADARVRHYHGMTDTTTQVPKTRYQLGYCSP